MIASFKLLTYHTDSLVASKLNPGREWDLVPLSAGNERNVDSKSCKIKKIKIQLLVGRPFPGSNCKSSSVLQFEPALETPNAR